MPMAQIEASVTQFGGGFGGAAGPVRSVKSRTCDLLPTVGRIAEILTKDLALGNRVERLLTRLEIGVPSVAVDLANLWVTS
jgi:helicase